MIKIATSLAAATVILPGTAMAHPGHGPEGGTSHYVTDPYHLVAGLLVVAMLAVIGVVARGMLRGSVTDQRG